MKTCSRTPWLTALLAALTLGIAAPVWADVADPDAPVLEEVTPADDGATYDGSVDVPSVPDSRVPTGSSANSDSSDSGIPLWALLVGGVALLGLLLFGAIMALLLFRKMRRNSKENAAGDALAHSEASRQRATFEFDDVRRELEAVREVLRAGGMDPEVSRCREVEKEVMTLSERLRQQPHMGGPSPDKLGEARGIAAIDAAVRGRAEGLLKAAGKLRERVDSGRTDDVMSQLDALSRQIASVATPLKDRPNPAAG